MQAVSFINRLSGNHDQRKDGKETLIIYRLSIYFLLYPVKNHAKNYFSTIIAVVKR
jgi:hypothetical protein